MARRDDLELLSARDLHDRAVGYAERHLDVRFLWELLKLVPVAETAAGQEDEADHDIAHWSVQVANAFRDDDGRLSEALRPVYIEYLERHPDA